MGDEETADLGEWYNFRIPPPHTHTHTHAHIHSLMTARVKSLMQLVPVAQGLLVNVEGLQVLNWVWLFFVDVKILNYHVPSH